jgi:hypothetical protein
MSQGVGAPPDSVEPDLEGHDLSRGLLGELSLEPSQPRMWVAGLPRPLDQLPEHINGHEPSVWPKAVSASRE